MAPGGSAPLAKVPSNPGVTVRVEPTEISIPSFGGTIEIPGVIPGTGIDLYSLGSDHPGVVDLANPNLNSGTMAFLGDPPLSTTGTGITPSPSSSDTSLAGGIIAGLSVFLGGCSGSPIFALAPALAVVTALSIYAIGRLFKGSAPENAPKEPADFALQARMEEPAEILQELLSPELVALRSRPEWAESLYRIENTQFGRIVYEDYLPGLFATGGPLTLSLKDPSLQKTLETLEKKPGQNADDVREFRAQAKVFLDRYNAWEEQALAYGKIPPNAPHKNFALADLHARWRTEVEPAINGLKSTNFYEAHRIYDEALVTLEINKGTPTAETGEINAIESALILQKASGVELEYKTVTRKPEDLPFEKAALEKLPKTDLIVLEITAPTKAKLLKIEETLKKQGLLPSPVAISFKTADESSESIWLPESAVEDKPLFGWNNLLMKKKGN